MEGKKLKISPWEAGTALYVPSANDKFMSETAKKISCSRRGPAHILCLEDSIRADEVEKGIANISVFFQKRNSFRSGRPVFIRPRNPENMRALLERGVCPDGFVLPKIDDKTLDDWPLPQEFSLMPTIETERAFDFAAMSKLAGKIVSLREKGHDIPLARIGGNDLQNLLGIKRENGATIYDGPLAHVFSMLATVFLPKNIMLAAPVFDNLYDAEALGRELEKDKAYGFCGKTAVHPDQVPHIMRAFAVEREGAENAAALMENDKAVFGKNGRMLEKATDSRWAVNIVERQNYFGMVGY